MRILRLYRENVYLTKAEADVLSVDLPFSARKYNASGASQGSGGTVLCRLLADKTVFFPTGGGQSCDLGTINGYPVIDVYEEGDAIYHVLEIPAEEAEAGRSLFAPGDTVAMEIDWSRRFDNMQRHCGEHIMSGVFHKLYHGTNRGFHMGEDYMTVDINFEGDDPPAEMTEEMLRKVELEVNRIIWQDLPVTASTFPSKEDAAGIPVRKPVEIEGEVTIVTVGDDFDPADSVACCGTHPTSAGQVGMLKIYKCEPNKGMHRVYFEAGERAFRHYVEKDRILGVLEKDLSAGVPDLLKKYRAKQEKQQEARDRLYHLTAAVLGVEEEKIRGELSLPEGERVFEYSVLTVDDLINLGRKLAPEVKGLLFLVQKPLSTVLLFSGGSVNCGKLVKDNAGVFGGKGGGSPEFARALFSRADDMYTFIDAAKKLTAR